MKPLIYLLVLGLPFTGMFFSGCADWEQIAAGPAYITVNDSPLNWVEIFYLREKDAPQIRLSMRGKGTVSIEQGRSKLVSDSFAHEYEAEEWLDRKTKTFTIPAQQQRETLQSLVNFGLLKIGEKPKGADLMKTSMLVKGNINGRKIDKYVFDDDLILQIEMLIALYSKGL